MPFKKGNIEYSVMFSMALESPYEIRIARWLGAPLEGCPAQHWLVPIECLNKRNSQIVGLEGMGPWHSRLETQI